MSDFIIGLIIGGLLTGFLIGWINNIQQTHLIDGKVLPRNEAQVNNGY